MKELVERYRLAPHPEGGWYRETYRAPRTVPGTDRSVCTAILYFLAAGQRSRLHRIDADELWHFYRGDPLELSLEWQDGRRAVHVVGPDVASGHAPQVAVEAGVWQSARPLGRYSLVGATVTPAFTFEGFELRGKR